MVLWLRVGWLSSLLRRIRHLLKSICRKAKHESCLWRQVSELELGQILKWESKPKFPQQCLYLMCILTWKVQIHLWQQKRIIRIRQSTFANPLRSIHLMSCGIKTKRPCANVQLPWRMEHIYPPRYWGPVKGIRAYVNNPIKLYDKLYNCVP